MIQKWKFISRRTLLNHPRMVMVEDKVELPNGKQADYLRQAPVDSHSVAIMAFNERGEMLLQREYSYPPDEVMYQLPGGGVMKDEDIIDAGNRELSEEAGYIGTDCEIIGWFYVNNRRSDSKQYIVVCRNLKQEKREHDAEEFIENTWVSMEKLNDLVRDGQIVNVNLLAALQLYNTRQPNTAQLK